MLRTLLLSAILLLAGCTSNAINYQLTFNLTDPAIQSDLTSRSLRVIDRRLERIGERVMKNSITKNEEGVLLTLELSDAVAIDTLSEELTAPFTLRIMRQAVGTEAPDAVVTGHGGFMETGLTEAHLNWADAREDPATQKGEVRLTFTPEGRALLADVFKKNKGKYIGLFVRDKLVSKLLVETDELKETIIIRDIPSPDVASIFADDLNVGLHVTFTPLP
jgi:preprotein translocase subunit SecD